MGKLVEHLMRCAVCGAVPKIKDTYEIDPKVPEPKVPEHQPYQKQNTNL